MSPIPFQRTSQLQTSHMLYERNAEILSNLTFATSGKEKKTSGEDSTDRFRLAEKTSDGFAGIFENVRNHNSIQGHIRVHIEHRHGSAIRSLAAFVTPATPCQWTSVRSGSRSVALSRTFRGFQPLLPRGRARQPVSSSCMAWPSLPCSSTTPPLLLIHRSNMAQSTRRPR